MKNYLDLYSVPVNFTYHKYYRYPSICGGIFSLIIEVLLLAYLIFLLYDISQRDFPEIATHTKYNAFPEQISIKSISSLGEKQNEISSSKHHKETYWSISLGIKKGNDLVKWETTNLEFKVYQKSIDVNGKLSSNEIKIEYCTGFGDGFLEHNVFDNMNLKTTKCINSDYNLTGIYGFANSSWLEIELIQTGNIDSNDKYQAEFYYQSRNLDLTQYTNDIIVSTLEEMFWDVMPKNIKVSYLKVSLDKVLTNDYYLPRFIVRKYKERYIFTTKSWNDQIKKVSDNKLNENNILLILRIIPDIISTTTERMFDDILTQLAMIGGLAGVVFPICFLFVFGIRNFRMSESTMNECYNIIDPQLQDNNNTIQSFDTFIINHYKKLLSLYKSQNVNDNNNKEQTQIKQKERTIGETYNTNDGLSFQTKKELINKYLNENELEDNEGIDVSMFNPSERFFTLKRIENLYGISEHQRRVININEDLTNMFNKQNVDPIKYVCYKFIYESTIYKSQPNFTFNICEMFGYFCFGLCCCKRKKKVFNLQTTYENKINKHQNNNNSNQTSLSQTKLSNTNITQKHILNKQSNEESNTIIQKQNEVSLLEQKYAVYYGANKKLGVDFDIINILKTIEGFDYFLKIYFEKHQRNLFYSAGKPLIQETDDNDDDIVDEENNDIICMYKNLLTMIGNPSGELKSYQVRLLKLMGRSDSDIKMLENVIKGKRINDNVYGDFIGGLNQNSERCSVNNNNDGVLQNDSMDLLKNTYQQKENNKEMVRDNISE